LASVLRDERTNDRDASRVSGDGVVDGVVREEGHCWTTHVMGGACDGACSGTVKAGSFRMDAKDHIGSSIYLASIWMRGDEAEETVEAGNGREGGVRV
jgi:hypothetical protein